MTRKSPNMCNRLYEILVVNEFSPLVVLAIVLIALFLLSFMSGGHAAGSQYYIGGAVMKIVDGEPKVISEGKFATPDHGVLLFDSKEACEKFRSEDETFSQSVARLKEMAPLHFGEGVEVVTACLETQSPVGFGDRSAAYPSTGAHT